MRKKLNLLLCVEFIILVEKWNVCEDHILRIPLLQTCRLETTSLCLNTRLFVNKKFPNPLYFIEINVNVCLLCAHQVITSIIFNTRRPVNKKSVTHMVFRFQRIFFFRILRSWKARFNIVPFLPPRYVLKSFMCLEVSNGVRNWNKIKKKIYVRSKLLLCQLEIPIFININVTEFINKLSFISVLWI